jgi:hypothetical protein
MLRPTDVLIAVLRFDGHKFEWMRADLPDHEFVALAKEDFADSGGREPQKWDVVSLWTSTAEIDAVAHHCSIDEIAQHTGIDGFRDSAPEDVAALAKEGRITGSLFAFLPITANGINNLPE